MAPVLDLHTCSEEFYVAEGRYFDNPALPLQKKINRMFEILV